MGVPWEVLRSISELQPDALVADLTLSNPWAVSTVVLVVLFLLKEVLKKWALEVAGYLQRRAYNRWAGRRFLRRAALRRYRSKLLEHHAKVPVPFAIGRDLRMDEVYVPLRAVHAKNDEEDADAAILATRTAMVVGAPGSGKSMLLRHVALQLVRARPAILWRQVPILLELHRLNKPGTTLDEHLVQQLDRDGFPHAERFLTRALDAGQVVVLLDGLDEVGSGQRQRVVQEIRDFLAKYDRCRMVVTCRTAVYNGELRDQLDRTFEVQELSAYLIRGFLYNWPGMPDIETIEQLMRALQDAPRIMALARNPLLLTIIAYLYTDVYESSARRLPHSRLDFYRDATDVLLRRWHEERNHFVAPQKRAVLQHLALFNQDRAGAGADRMTIEYKTVLAQVGTVMSTLNREPQEAPAILNEIVERSGLLLAVDGGERYQFAHLTLQEYFAASELVNDPRGLLRRFRADPATWREPLLLWCGGDQDSTHMIRELHEFAPMMAFECLAVAQRVDDQIADVILVWAKGGLSVIEDREGAARAFGMVASDERPRGRDVFQFLKRALDDPVLSRRTMAAEALAGTNLPKAAATLARSYTLDGIRPALVRMGDLAVPALAELAIEGHVGAFDDLLQIATPNAAEALTELLWSDDDRSVHAAWRLAVLLRESAIEHALDQLPIQQWHRSKRRIEWLWRPFAEASSNRAVIAGRIGYVLHQGELRLAPATPLPLDPRLCIPLITMRRADWFRAPGDDVELDDRSRAVLERLRGHLELRASGSIGLARRSISALGGASRLRFQDLEPLLQADRDDPDTLRLQLELLNVIVPQFATSNHARYLLSCLSVQMRSDVIRRLVAYRAFERDHWVNLFRPIKYSFGNSLLYRLVLLIAVYSSVLAIWELWYQIHQPHTGPGRLLPWWEIFVILLTWIFVFAMGGAYDPSPLLLAALGPLVTLAFITEEPGKRVDHPYLTATLAIPVLIGSVSVAIRATMAAHRLTRSWLLTVTILVIVGWWSSSRG